MIDISYFQQQINELQKLFEGKAKKLDDRDLRIIKCSLGANEEAGELAHVVLKSITGHYGYDCPEKVKEKVTDAVVDMVVFGLQILNEYDVSFEEVFPKVLSDVIERNKNNVPHIPIQK